MCICYMSNKFPMGSAKVACQKEGKVSDATLVGMHSPLLRCRLGESGSKAIESVGRPPLPVHLLSLGECAFTVFFTNLSDQISKLELEVLFCKAG